MKLFEVLYPKCKKCGYDFSKGGRDHRVGVCDVCAFPNRKKKVKEAMQTDPFTAKVEDLLWGEYQSDPLFPAEVTYPTELDDEDYLDFEEHVRDVVKFAQQHHIRNPRKALELYTDAVAQKYKPTLH